MYILKKTYTQTDRQTENNVNDGWEGEETKNKLVKNTPRLFMNRL